MTSGNEGACATNIEYNYSGLSTKTKADKQQSGKFKDLTAEGGHISSGDTNKNTQPPLARRTSQNIGNANKIVIASASRTTTPDKTDPLSGHPYSAESDRTNYHAATQAITSNNSMST